MVTGHGGKRWGGGQKYLTSVAVVLFGEECLSLKQFSRHRIECDGRQKGENETALEHTNRKSADQRFQFQMQSVFVSKLDNAACNTRH